MFYEAIMSISISSILIAYYVKSKFKTPSVSLEAYFVLNAIPVLRTSLILLYFFVVLHKLNFDFFETGISCGAVLFENMLNNTYLTKLSFINDFYSNNQILLANFSIYSALLAELMIPLLLIFRRSRKIGLILAMIFHLILGFEGLGAIISFTAMMFTYFSVFWSNKTLNRVINYIAPFKNQLRLGFIIFLVALLIAYTLVSERFFKQLVGVVWIIYSISLILIFIKLSKLKISSNLIRFKPSASVYWVFPAILILNGFSPYLGLKTQTAFSMFSNLKTENASNNHFFIPKELQLFNYQKEIVVINDTNMEGLTALDAWNHTIHYKYVLFEFIKIVNAVDNGYVNFSVNHKDYYVKKENGKVLISNIDLNQNIILEKILLFRPIYDHVNLCQQ